MSIYFIRMIEILSLESVEDEHYLYVSLQTTTTKPIHVYWKIDASIARQLYIYCDFQGKSRYRLSLRAHPTADETIVGGVTKTHLTTSQRFDLLVTEEFQTQLKTINTRPSPIQVLRLRYLLTLEQFEDTKMKKQLQAYQTRAKKVVATPDKPLLDLAKFVAAGFIRATRPAEAPIFTSHANTNAYLFPHLIQGSRAF